MSWPCVKCKRHAFPVKGTVCFWCRPAAKKIVAVESGPTGRPTMDELKMKIQAMKYDKRKARGRGAR